MNFWDKYKVYIIGLITAILLIASTITYVELTSGKKAEKIIQPEMQRVDSLFKLLEETNQAIESVAKNIKKNRDNYQC